MMDVFGDDPVIWDDAQAVREAAYTSATEYLSIKREQLEGHGISVETTMEHGRASDVILRLAEANAPDLIAMSTHGRSGLSRMVLGSVSGQVLRGVATPLLLVRPQEDDTGPVATLSDMIIPLDMSTNGEGVLPLAVDLAKVLDLKVTLVMALPNMSQFFAGTEPVAYPPDFLDVAEATIRDYLEETTRRITKESGCRSVGRYSEVMPVRRSWILPRASLTISSPCQAMEGRRWVGWSWAASATRWCGPAGTPF